MCVCVCIYVFKYCEHRFRETFYVLRSDDLVSTSSCVIHFIAGFSVFFANFIYMHFIFVQRRTLLLLPLLLLLLLVVGVVDAAVLLMASHNCYSTNIYIYNINILIAMQQFPNSNIRYIFNVLLSNSAHLSTLFAP